MKEEDPVTIEDFDCYAKAAGEEGDCKWARTPDLSSGPFCYTHNRWHYESNESIAELRQAKKTIEELEKQLPLAERIDAIRHSLHVAINNFDEATKLLKTARADVHIAAREAHWLNMDYRSSSRSIADAKQANVRASFALKVFDGITTEDLYKLSESEQLSKPIRDLILATL